MESSDDAGDSSLPLWQNRGTGKSYKIDGKKLKAKLDAREEAMTARLAEAEKLVKVLQEERFNMP